MRRSLGSILRISWTLIKQTFAKWDDDNASWLAAALAYYTIFSLAPVVIIVIAICGFIFGEQAVQGELERQIGLLIGGRAASIIQVIIQSASKPSSGLIAAIVGGAVLLFGATNVFAQLQGTLNKIWRVESKNRTWIKSQAIRRLTSLAIVLSIGFLILLLLLVDTALLSLQKYLSELLPGSAHLTLLRVGNQVISFAIMTLLFAATFKAIPQTKVAWGDVWLGAVLTSVLFMIGKLLTGLYISNSTIISAFGAAGSVIVILFWFYYSAQILFFGAEFTYVYANQIGSRKNLSESLSRPMYERSVQSN